MYETDITTTSWNYVTLVFKELSSVALFSYFFHLDRFHRERMDIYVYRVWKQTASLIFASTYHQSFHNVSLFRRKTQEKFVFILPWNALSSPSRIQP